MSVRRISRILRRLVRDDEGLGMPEVIVAIMVFGVIATTAAYGMVNALTLTQRSRSSETALSIASSDLDQMRLTASSGDAGLFSVVSNPSAVVKSVGGTTYTVARSVSWQTTVGAIGACGTGTGTLQYKNVTDTVTWRSNTGATQSVTMSSAIAPLSNINSDTTGTIIVTVKGVTAPVSGVAITITPDTSTGASSLPNAPQSTDVDGCSFGLLADPGTYTVTASMPGGVDIGGKATASAKVVVVAGQNSVQNFTYDVAAKFPLSYPLGAVVPTNLPITLANSTVGATKYAATSATGTPSVPALGWSDGYTIVAGTYVSTAASSTASCVDTNPGSWTTPRGADGAVGTAPSPVVATGGTTAPITAVGMGTLTLSNLGLLNTSYITAVTAPPGDGDPGCAAGQTLTFPRLSGLGSMTIALPYGTWRFYAGSTAGSTTTALPSGSTGKIVPISPATVNGSGSSSSITLDPRTAP